MNNLIGWKCQFYNGIRVIEGVIYDKYIHDYGEGIVTYYIILNEQDQLEHIPAINIKGIINKVL